jgi:hypothetical protein
LSINANKIPYDVNAYMDKNIENSGEITVYSGPFIGVYLPTNSAERM